MAVVLDRTTPKAVREVASHLARMLTARGLGDSPLFTVPEAAIDADGLLPPEAVSAIRTWLERLAVDSAARSTVVRKTLDGAVRSLGHRARTVSDALFAQEEIGAQLRKDVDRLVRRQPARRRAGVRRRHAPARRGARALAGVRRHRRADAQHRGQGRPHPRPPDRRGARQAAAGPAADGGRRVRPADAAGRARRERSRARGPRVALAPGRRPADRAGVGRPLACLARLPRARPRRPSASGRAPCSTSCVWREPTVARRLASSRSGSTGSGSR